MIKSLKRIFSTSETSGWKKGAPSADGVGDEGGEEFGTK